MVDTGAATCITNDIGGSVGQVQRIDVSIGGLKHYAAVNHKGTLRWTILDR